jgi:hypothetical protein
MPKSSRKRVREEESEESSSDTDSSSLISKENLIEEIAQVMISGGKLATHFKNITKPILVGERQFVRIVHHAKFLAGLETQKPKGVIKTDTTVTIQRACARFQELQQQIGRQPKTESELFALKTDIIADHIVNKTPLTPQSLKSINFQENTVRGYASYVKKYEETSMHNDNAHPSKELIEACAKKVKELRSLQE